MATATATRTKLVIESAEAVLGLHWFVARDYTAKEEGLEFEIITPGIKTKFDWNDPRSRDHHLVSSTNYQKAFEEGKADVYRACEWGQIRRTYDNPKGPIVARRPAMVYQAIFVRPDSPINATIALANKTVGVQFHQGSHYATLAMLEGFMPREKLQVVHSGTVQERYEALMNGETDAATLMEPWATLAFKNGCKDIISTFYQGTENAGESLDPKVWGGGDASGQKGRSADQRRQAEICARHDRGDSSEVCTADHAGRLLSATAALCRSGAIYSGRVRTRLQLDGDLGPRRGRRQI